MEALHIRNHPPLPSPTFYVCKAAWPYCAACTPPSYLHDERTSVLLYSALHGRTMPYGFASVQVQVLFLLLASRTACVCHAPQLCRTADAIRFVFFIVESPIVLAVWCIEALCIFSLIFLHLACLPSAMRRGRGAIYLFSC